jgi:hypothetical protein
VLVAEPESAQAACADANGNGRSGLTRLAFASHDPRTGQRVPIVLAPRKGEEIDQSGAGFVAIEIGETVATAEVDVRLRRRSGRRKGDRR